MSVQNGILALLSTGPAYGSELQGEFLARAVHRRRLNAGQVYATLERLTAQKLVRSAGVTDDGLPLYALTDAGERAADDWLSVAVAGVELDWNEMQDQVLIAASIDGAKPLGIVSGYESALGSEATRLLSTQTQALQAAEQSAHRAADLNASAALTWLAEIADQLREDPARFVRRRSPERPRRGRRPNPG